MFDDRFNTTDLPEFWITDDGQKVAAPTYEATQPCYMVMTSAETGQTGPTKIEPGEVFTSEMAPNHAWMPLNRAAGENYDRWLASLPVDGKNVSQELITEAAYTLRPREGDPEFTHEVWWANVMRLAVSLAEKRRGSGVFNPRPAAAIRPNAAQTPVMSFASQGNTMMQPGQPPAGAALYQPQNALRAATAQRKRTVTPPMTNAPPAQGPQSA